MTRLLTITSVVATLILLKVLNDRPPIQIHPEVGNDNQISTIADDLPVDLRKNIKEVEPWPVDLQMAAREALDLWHLEQDLLPQLYDPAQRSDAEERLRAEWICKKTLLRLASTKLQDHELKRQLRLSSGALLQFKSLVASEGMVTVELPDGLRINIAPSQIVQIDAPASEKIPVELITGSLADTLDLIDQLGTGQTVAHERWMTWFEKGGPESLSTLMTTKGSRLLDRYLARIWKNTASATEPGSIGGRSPLALSDWISGIRKKLREGFPTEEREETLLTLKSWQTWLDRNGDRAYGSRQAYVAASRDLRLLQLDIVKSTGF